MLADESAATELRVVALRGLLKSGVSDAAALIDKLVSTNNVDLRIEAVNQLVASDADRAIPLLARAIESESILERQNAWDALAKLKSDAAKELIAKGVDSYLSNTLPKEVRLNVFEAAKKVRTEDTRKKMEAYIEKQEPLKTSDPVAFYADSELGGDVSRGRKIFFEKTQVSCLRCHKIADVGGEVGPALTTIGKDKNVNYLLEAIVAPNAKIAENFKTVIVQTEEGKIYSGSCEQRMMTSLS